MLKGNTDEGKEKVANSRHTIELNGRLYDAVTGEILTSPAKSSTHSAKHALPAASNKKVVDGFTKRKHITVADSSHPAKPSPTRKRLAQPKTIKPAPKRVQKSATLMRGVVHKPTPAQRKASPAVIAKHTSPSRLRRAHSVSRSQLISKFGSLEQSLKAQVTVLPVQSAPIMRASTVQQAPPPLTLPRHSTDRPSRGRAATSRSHHSKPAQAPAKTVKTAKTKTPRRSLAHRAAKKLHVSPKTVHLASGLAALVILSGFIVYQNIPNLAMRVAAARAGISAQLPQYQPAGFSLSGAIQYSPGKIMVSYRSNSDDRSFSLVQSATDWTPEALLENHVAAGRRPYQTFENDGRTIYIYEGSKATWIEGGVWYQVDGNSALNTEQLLRLATSI